MGDSESGWAVAMRRGERAACEAFVDTHYRALYRHFWWLTHDREAASDLTQETFAAFWASLQSGPGDRQVDLQSWLFGIARNRWRKRCRDGVRGRAEGTGLEAAARIADRRLGPEAQALEESQAQILRRAVNELPARYREVLLLRAVEELGYDQIGTALGISPAVARWRVHRARSLLRATLAEPAEKEESSAPQRG